MKTMSRVTREDITRALGHVDDVVVTSIIGTGASADELAEAKAWITNDEPLLNAGKPLASGRVRDLIEILAEIDSSDDEEEASSATN
jgi:hypothetical protein